MKRVRLVILLLMLVLSGCRNNNTAQPLEEANLAFNEYLDQLVSEYYDPTDISINYSFIDPEAYGITPQPYELGVTSQEDFNTWITYAQSVVSKLSAFSDDELSQSQIYDRDVLVDYYQREADNGPYYDYVIGNGLIGYSRSINVQLPSILEVYQFRKVRDVTYYLHFINHLPEDFSTIVSFEKARQERGTGLGQEELDEVIRLSQAAATAAQAEDYYLIADFNQRIDAVDFLSDDEKATYKQQNQEALNQSMAQAYRNLAEGLATIEAGQTTGLANKPNGQAYYQVALAQATGSDRTIAEISALMSERIRAIQNNMQLLQAKDETLIDTYQTQYYTENFRDFGSGISQLAYLSEQIYPDFPAIGSVNYEMRTVDASQAEGSSPAFYFTPPVDYTKDQKQYIYINGSYDPSLYTTYAHEGLPGHMYQFNYFLKRDMHPIRLLITNTGNAEGWANYAETYAVKYVIDDPDYLVFWQDMTEYNELLNIMLDIGINEQGWSREELLEQWKIWINDEATLADIEETYVYFAHVPAVYPTYYLSALYIRDMHDRYVQKTGQTDDDLQFHERFLELGSAGLDVIEKHLSDILEK